MMAIVYVRYTPKKSSHYAAVVRSGRSESTVILQSHYALTLVRHISPLTNYCMVLLNSASRALASRQWRDRSREKAGQGNKE